MGYVPNISALPFYVAKDEHFLFNDIQLSKGKLTKGCHAKYILLEEELYSLIAPCGGIKQCSMYDCSYVAAISQGRVCPEHTEAELVVSKDCPVEFVCVWPEDSEDK